MSMMLDVTADSGDKESGLYAKTRNGDIPNLTGIDSPYEIPRYGGNHRQR